MFCGSDERDGGGGGADDDGKRKKEISVQWVERKLALSYILIILILFTTHFVFARTLKMNCARVRVGEMMKRPFFTDGNRL